MDLREPGSTSGDALVPLISASGAGHYPPNANGVTVTDVKGAARRAARPSSDPTANRTMEFETPSAFDLPAQKPADPAPQPPGPEAKGEKPADAGPRLLRKPKRPRRRFDAPAWVVSGIVHVGIFGVLALLTVAADEVVKKPIDLNTSLVATTDASDEEMPILNDPSNGPRDTAVGDPSADAGQESSGVSVDTTGGFRQGIGSGPPSDTPVVGGRGTSTASVGQGSLPSVQVVKLDSPMKSIPTTPNKDLTGGGGIAGDVFYKADTHGVALDQLAREILIKLQDSKLTVVWMFDESESMKDDQKAVRDKFSRVTKELKLNVDPKLGPTLTHAIVGFGEHVHLEIDKPTANIDSIGKAIERLRVDPSGIEKTNHAIREVIKHYSPLIRKDHKLLIVLVTDEAGDDGADVEEALQAAKSKSVPIYVIGRQSPFGYPSIRHKYVDPVTGDTYWPTIHRGPETADVECLQWDGLHDRWEEQPSGFAPYELARLAKGTGGIYFLLPTEEEMRSHQREKAYSTKTLKEYIPPYESRTTYVERRDRSDLRRELVKLINDTRGFSYRRHYPIDPAGFSEAAQAEFPIVNERLNALDIAERRLKALEKQRDRETEKRWQAHYDLILAQIVAYKIQAYEYRATLQAMLNKLPVPSKPPGPDTRVEWILDHAQQPRAPKIETEKKYHEATKLLKLVIERHPNTPWADLAQVELNRGFSVGWYEWRSNPQYEKRAALVPKY